MSYDSNATATADTTETGASFKVLASMTITPGSGDYVAIFTGSGKVDTNAACVYVALFYNGSEIAESRIEFCNYRSAEEGNFSTAAYIAGVGAAAIDVRWYRTAGTSTCHARNLILLKVG